MASSLKIHECSDGRVRYDVISLTMKGSYLTLRNAQVSLSSRKNFSLHSNTHRCRSNQIWHFTIPFYAPRVLVIGILWHEALYFPCIGFQDFQTMRRIINGWYFRMPEKKKKKKLVQAVKTTRHDGTFLKINCLGRPLREKMQLIRTRSRLFTVPHKIHKLDNFKIQRIRKKGRSFITYKSETVWDFRWIEDVETLTYGLNGWRQSNKTLVRKGDLIKVVWFEEPLSLLRLRVQSLIDYVKLRCGNYYSKMGSVWKTAHDRDRAVGDIPRHWSVHRCSSTFEVRK